MSIEWTFKFRRGTGAEWTDVDPVLEAGEPGVEIDTDRMKIGDGLSRWSELGYIGFSPNDVTRDELESLVRGIMGNLDQSDAAVAALLDNPASESHGAVVEIVHDETDPLVRLNLLFNNAIA